MPTKLPKRDSVPDRATIGVVRRIRQAAEAEYTTTPIAEVAEVVSGGTPSTSNSSYWGGGITWVTPKDLGAIDTIEVDTSDRTITEAGLQSSSAKLLPEGAVLLSSRAPIGYLGISARPLATNQGFKNIIPGPDVSSRYLFHMLRGSIREIQSQGRGNTFDEIPAKVVESLEIPVPSTAVQDEIVAFCDAVCSAAQNGEEQQLPQLPSSLKNLRGEAERILSIARRLEEVQKLRFRSGTEIEALEKSATHAAFRQFWDEERQSWRFGRRLDSVCDLLLGATPSRSNAAYWNGEHTWVKISDLNGGEVTESEEHITDAGVKNSSVKLVEPGTLMMSFKLTIGKMGVAGTPLYTNEAIVSLPIKDEDELDVSYLRFALKAIDLLRGTKEAMMGKTLNKTTLSKMVLPVPTLAVQKQVVAELTSFESAYGKVVDEHDSVGELLEDLLPTVLA